MKANASLIAVRNTDVARGMGKAWHDIEVSEAIEQDTQRAKRNGARPRNRRSSRKSLRAPGR